MVFTDNTAALSVQDKIELNEVFVKFTEDSATSIHITASITTFRIDASDQSFESVPYSRKRADSKAMESIRVHRGVKPISDDKLQNEVMPIEVGYGVLNDYFQKYDENHLTLAEKRFVEENDYSLDTSWYFSIPFPSGDNVKGFYFPLLHNESDFLRVKECLGEITKKINKHLKG